MTHDEIGGLRIEGRPAGSSPAVGPLASDELAVLAKEGLGGHHERAPPIPRQRPARRGKEHPVAVFELRPADGPPEHPHLVTEHGVLELKLRHAPASNERPQQANMK